MSDTPISHDAKVPHPAGCTRPACAASPAPGDVVLAPIPSRTGRGRPRPAPCLVLDVEDAGEERWLRLLPRRSRDRPTCPPRRRLRRSRRRRGQARPRAAPRLRREPLVHAGPGSRSRGREARSRSHDPGPARRSRAVPVRGPAPAPGQRGRGGLSPLPCGARSPRPASPHRHPTGGRHDPSRRDPRRGSRPLRLRHEDARAEGNQWRALFLLSAGAGAGTAAVIATPNTGEPR